MDKQERIKEMLAGPLVSVIIPTYNRAEFVPAAVQSVLNQSYSNVEIIVVDDGSTDDTQSALEQFRENIHYIVTKNKGPAHARNVGMKAATGKYIAFLDSDDLYLPYKLELEVSFMETHPEVGMVCTEFSATDGNVILEEHHLRSFHPIYDREGWSYEDIFPIKGKFLCKAVGKPIPFYVGDLFKHVLMGSLIVSTTVLFQRDILNKVGYQNETYHVAEEYEMIVRICKHFKVGFLNVPTYLYRYHGNQISKINQARTKENILTEIEIEKVFLQAVLDWACGDKEYYAKNKDWLNHRIARKFNCLGEKWLEYGEPKKARNCFQKGYSFDPTLKKNRKNWWFSFLPATMRRVIQGANNRLSGKNARTQSVKT